MTLAPGGDLSSLNCYWGKAVCLLCCRRHCLCHGLSIDLRPCNCCIGTASLAAGDISVAGSSCSQVGNSIDIDLTILQATCSLCSRHVLVLLRCPFG